MPSSRWACCCGLVASFLWIVNSIYSIGYMRGNKEGHQTRFYVCFAIALASTMGLAFSANLLTLFVFYEALTLSTYPLVTHAGTEKAVRAGRVYLGILISTSIVLLLSAILITWQQTGTLTFVSGGILQGKVSDTLGLILLVMFMYGIGKAALMPIHPWLPAAMVAPTPVSALLHAVAVVKAGVFTVVKVIVYVFGLDYLQNLGGSEWLLYVSGATIVIASVIALQADNLKRRLAYSTVSQLSYVIMAAALFTPMAVAGAILHIAAHAFGKITLFFAAGSIYTRGPQDGGEPARRHRPAHALDDGGVRHRRALHDRPAADRRFCLEMVFPVRRAGRPLGRDDLRDLRQHPAQCRLFPAHRLPRLLPAGAGRRTARRSRRSALPHRAGADRHRGRDNTSLPDATAAGARTGRGGRLKP